MHPYHAQIMTVTWYSDTNLTAFALYNHARYNTDILVKLLMFFIQRYICHFLRYLTFLILIWTFFTLMDSTSASIWLKRLVSEMTYNVLIGDVKSTHSLTCLMGIISPFCAACHIECILDYSHIARDMLLWLIKFSLSLSLSLSL